MEESQSSRRSNIKRLLDAFEALRIASGGRDEVQMRERKLEAVHQFLGLQDPSLREIFGLLPGGSEEFPAEELMQTLSCVFDVLPHLIYSEEVLPFILQGLYSDDEAITKATLDELIALLSSGNIAQLLARNDEIFHGILQCLFKESTETSYSAKRLLVIICSGDQGSDRIFSKETLNFLEENYSKPDINASSINFLRALDLLVSVGLKDSSSFRKLRISRKLDEILEKLNSSDILMQLNIFETLMQICTKDYGLQYLVDVQLMTILSHPNFSAENSEVLPWTHSALLKTVRSMVVSSRSLDYNSWILEQKSSWLPLLSSFINEDADSGVLGEALLLLGELLSIDSVLAFLFINQKSIFHRLSEFAHSSHQSVQASCLHGIACVLDAYGSRDSNEIKENIDEESLKQLVSGISVDMVGTREARIRAIENADSLHDSFIELYTFCKSLDNDLRFAAYRILSHLVQFSWGLLGLAQTHVIDHILDRTNESVKIGIEWKFLILRNALHSKHFSRIAGFSVHQRIQEYVSQGPFFACKAAPKVVFESN